LNKSRDLFAKYIFCHKLSFSEAFYVDVGIPDVQDLTTG